MAREIQSNELPQGETLHLFADPLYCYHTDHVEDLVTLDMIENTRKHLFKSQQFSNVGGYQSSHLVGQDDKHGDWSKLYAHVEEHMRKYLEQNGCRYPDVKMKGSGLWINVNGRGHYNKPHNHVGTSFSGIFYVQVPKHSGGLYFMRGSQQNGHIEMMCSQPEYGPLFEIMPSAGDLFLFPSELVHGVYPNYSKSDRISVSFNINIVGWAY